MGAGAIIEDPQFIDFDNNNYNLQDISPCINAGDPDSFYNDPDYTRNDMGAFPYGPDYLCGDVDNGGSIGGSWRLVPTQMSGSLVVEVGFTMSDMAGSPAPARLACPRMSGS